VLSLSFVLSLLLVLCQSCQQTPECGSAFSLDVIPRKLESVLISLALARHSSGSRNPVPWLAPSSPDVIPAESGSVDACRSPLLTSFPRKRESILMLLLLGLRTKAFAPLCGASYFLALPHK
jgi:hypothetical protein